MFSVNYKGMVPKDLVREEMNRSLEWFEGRLPTGSDIHLSVEPERKRREYNLVLTVRTLRHRLTAHAHGGNLLSLMKSLQRQIDRQRRKMSQRRVSRRRWKKNLYPSF